MKRRSSTSETASIVAPTLKALNGIPGVIAIRLNAGRSGRVYLGKAGQPDLVAIVRGKAIFFEAKTKAGQLSPAQVEWHKRARVAGTDVHVIRSVSEAVSLAAGLLAQ